MSELLLNVGRCLLISTEETVFGHKSHEKTVSRFKSNFDVHSATVQDELANSKKGCSLRGGRSLTGDCKGSRCLASGLPGFREPIFCTTVIGPFISLKIWFQGYQKAFTHPFALESNSSSSSSMFCALLWCQLHLTWNISFWEIAKDRKKTGKRGFQVRINLECQHVTVRWNSLAN